VAVVPILVQILEVVVGHHGGSVVGEVEVVEQQELTAEWSAVCPLKSSGVKVSRNAPEHHSGARKFKPGAFRLQNYCISQLEPTFLSPAS